MLYSYILGKVYEWDTPSTNSIIFNKDNLLTTSWGNGYYKCLKNNMVEAVWNDYRHILSFTNNYESFTFICLNNDTKGNGYIKNYSLTDYLNINNHFNFLEGYSQQVKDQTDILINLTTKPNINVLEIGFNAGHSADTFLKNNASLKLTSFDLGQYAYNKSAKDFIDSNYPERHTLIYGDSTVTIPEFINNNPYTRFDLIFIDGGHEYSIVKADMENCMRLSTKDTIVIVDDTIFTEEWKEEYTIGPTQIWNEYLLENKLIELGRVEFGKGRGMVWGKYTIC
jgi:predicted O-methyltransferase YrrM